MKRILISAILTLLVAIALLVAMGGGCKKSGGTLTSGEDGAVALLPETPPEPQEITLTMMTYNAGAFRKSLGDLGHYSYGEVATVIKSVGPVIVALNETDWGGVRSPGEKQAKKLAARLGTGWSAKFFSAGYSWYGNAIVWDKHKISSNHVYDRMELEKTDGYEVRSMGAIDFNSFVFCVTHLDQVSETDRLNAVDKISCWAKENYGDSDKPVFLVGDMNAEPAGATVAKFRENWLQLSGEDLTYPADAPRKCIDYIFVFKNGADSRVELLSSGIVTEDDVPEAITASDHRPVWATVRIHRDNVWLFTQITPMAPSN